jgi:hypothetical protein
MTRYCPNCGAEVPQGATFCSNCGRHLSQDASQQTQQQTTGPDPTAQTVAPTQTQQQPVFTPPQAPPPGGGGGRRGLLLGGLAVAGVLGFIMLLVVGALIYFFATRPASTQPPPQPEGGGEEQPEGGEGQPIVEDGEGQPPPPSGSLDDLIQEQVGDFTLQQIDTLPEAIDAGATDARQMVYASPDGVQVSHNLSAWSSPDVANQNLQGFVESWVNEGFEVAEEFSVTSDDQQVGSGVALVGEIEGTQYELIFWTNDVLFAEVYAPSGYGVDFLNNVPY